MTVSFGIKVNMRLLNHCHGLGAKHKLLRADMFGRVASRCLLLTFRGGTKCLSLG